MSSIPFNSSVNFEENVRNLLIIFQFGDTVFKKISWGLNHLSESTGVVNVGKIVV